MPTRGATLLYSDVALSLFAIERLIGYYFNRAIPLMGNKNQRTQSKKRRNNK